MNDHHIVRPGETLHGIAQEEGIRLESLLEYNNLTSSSYPQTGSRLTLQGESIKGSVMSIFKK
jgi:LysM repeat protein